MVAKILNAISLILIVVMFIYAGVEYSHLPETIPIHYDISGMPDGFSGKEMLWSIPAIALLLYVIITLLSKYQVDSLINAPNAVKSNPKLMSLLLNLVLLFCILIFAEILCSTILIATGKLLKSNFLFTLSMIILMFISIFGVNRYAKKLKK